MMRLIIRHASVSSVLQPSSAYEYVMSIPASFGWVPVLMPPFIFATFFLLFVYQRHKSKEHIRNIVINKVADSYWEEAQTIAADAHENEHTEDGWKKRGQTTVKDTDPDIAASKIQSAFKGYAHRKSASADGDSMLMPHHQIRNMMLKRAVKLAVARQNCIGWAFRKFEMSFCS